VPEAFNGEDIYGSGFSWAKPQRTLGTHNGQGSVEAILISTLSPGEQIRPERVLRIVTNVAKRPCRPGVWGVCAADLRLALVYGKNAPTEAIAACW
jgi:hypothetical protein